MVGKNSTLSNQKHISITPPSFMKFCPVVPEICRGQVHASRKERRIRIIIIKIKILIRNGAKTISLQTLFGRLNNNNNKKRSKNNKSPKFDMWVDSVRWPVWETS
jgi:hypothetical protein